MGDVGYLVVDEDTMFKRQEDWKGRTTSSLLAGACQTLGTNKVWGRMSKFSKSCVVGSYSVRA